ncbi:MAG: hypothetical protein K9K82_08385 [Desulfobacteraceae bacterium]|nr:hypothetical protein [Desulfobacteraceae bacterium]
MKKQLLLVTGILSLAACFCLASAGSAAAQSWEEEFSRALAEIQEAAQAGEPGDGLGYTPSLEDMLDEAIGNAMAQGGGGCQVMKMAVDMDFNPYPVLLSIYSRGSVSLDEVCMCATEQGVSKAVIAQAATSAAGPGGQPAYSQDEVAQCQCLQEGLPYTQVQAQPPPQPNPPDPVPPDSVSTP